jgi:hypothetical protein
MRTRYIFDKYGIVVCCVAKGVLVDGSKARSKAN